MTDILQGLGRIGVSGDVPRTMGELEAALGIHFVDGDLVKPKRLGVFEPERALGGDLVGLSAVYAWDMYHENLVTTVDDLRRRAVFEFTLHLARGRSAIARALYERFGAPRSVREGLVYERWILVRDGRGDDACRLSRYQRLPDWAVPQPDPAIRGKVLLELVGAAATDGTLDELERIAKGAPSGSGIVFGGRGSNQLSIELVPPMPVLELAELFGWQSPHGVSSDVHQSSWRLKTIVGTGPDGVVTSPPVYGRWNIHAAFDSRPTGGALPEVHAPPGGALRAGPADVVRTFGFSQF